MNHQEFITSVANEFETAYLTTGLDPVRRTFGDVVKSGCMVTALAKQILGNKKQLSVDLMIETVKDYLQDNYKDLKDANWWVDCFVNYCMLTFDGMATYPKRWMKRNARTIFTTNDSPKKMGAAVAGLVYRRVTAPVQHEKFRNNTSVMNCSNKTLITVS